jgi:hypothetical protein
MDHTTPETGGPDGIKGGKGESTVFPGHHDGNFSAPLLPPCQDGMKDSELMSKINSSSFQVVYVRDSGTVMDSIVSIQDSC